MIFPLYLVLIIVGAVLLWYVLYAVARFVPVAEGEVELLGLHEQHSVTEQFFDRAEVAFENAVMTANRLLRIAALNILTKVIPYFRKATSGIETVLLNMVGALRGQHHIDSLDRGNSSAFVKDIKSHATLSRKNGGVIHEDGAASRLPAGRQGLEPGYDNLRTYKSE